VRSTIRDIRKVVREGYDKIDYQRHYRQDRELTAFEARLLDLLSKNVPESSRILDLGSGPGIPYDAHIVSKGHALIGVDNCPKAIDQAKANVPSAQYVQGDMLLSLTSFEDQSFGGIVSFYAIFHLPRKEHRELFCEMWRMLGPGGVILVTLGTSNSEYGEESDWCGAKMAWSSYPPDVYKRMIVEAGFTLLETEFEGKPGDEEYHLWVLARKASPKT
jgi:SAM-dependent methyltransferase